ncbi:P-loop containing nucleoside triphosphate hydrolase protein [Poronia punctata]|nr:P-loop containing nucleoside triphosphate hydrolase protein [Poronia punctata]
MAQNGSVPLSSRPLRHRRSRSGSNTALLAEKGTIGTRKPTRHLFQCRKNPVYSLQDISLRVTPGERVAVCGRSGSGKYTLLLALLALVDCPKGKIFLDGIDTSHVPRSLLRARFHVISQDTFTTTQGGRGEMESDVLRECSILDNVIVAGGLSAPLTTTKLSVGEAQLFVLARTILQAEGRVGSTNGGVVLLDEATRSVDTATEKKVMALIERKLRGEKTIISILRRLEVALEYSDRILMLENGEVVCSGTPEEVVRDSDLSSSLR